MSWRYCTVAMAAIVAFSTSATAQNQRELGSERARQSMRINVDVEDTDLADVMEQIGQKVERNILVDPNVRETVTVSLNSIPWREAVEVIAKMTRCEVEDRGNGVLLLTQPPKVTIQFQDANVRTVLQLLAAYSGKNIIISPQVTGEVTLDLKEVHWLRALHAIVKTSGDYEVVEDGDELLRVVPRSAIERQLETTVFKLKYARPPASYRAIPPSSAGTGSSGSSSNQAQASVFIGSVTTAAADNVRDTFTLYRSLNSVVTSSQIPGAALEYDEQTNAFIVTATRPLLNQLEKIIKRVDLRPAQIYTEVKFVATTDNNNQNYGFEFGEGLPDQGLRWSNQQHGPFVQGVPFNYVAGFNPSEGFGTRPAGNVNGQNARGRSSPAGFSQLFTSTGPNQQGLITTDQLSVNPGRMPFFFGDGLSSFTNNFRLPALLNLGEFNMVLNLLDRDSRTRTIQSPSLFMLDNQDAVIFVGDQVPYATFTTTQDANGNQQASITEGSRSPVAIGFSLFVQPHVLPDEDAVVMTIIPRVNDLVGTTSSIPGFEQFSFGFNNTQIDLPRTREQALVTHVMLQDTQTAVLGGLLTEVDTEVIKRIPFLSSLPLIGHLFTNTQTNKRLENLTIFVTPTIIRQRKSVDSIFMRATKRLEDADYFYNKYEKSKLSADGDDDDDDDDDDE
ncbi:MAG: hypothetical protein JKY65_01565 [Planctomycetes bacterium]|nr:hypothetical protein [Planctomycetota bacterium]